MRADVQTRWIATAGPGEHAVADFMDFDIMAVASECHSQVESVPTRP
jgi:hypothetical protein